MYRVLIYKETRNLGDAVQAYAMARLLPPPLLGVFRDEAYRSTDNSVPFVVNGWLGDRTPGDPNTLFAGVFLGRRKAEQLNWISRSHFRVGARDETTCKTMRSVGLKSEVVGCATMTLPRFQGERKGHIYVDLRSSSAGSGLEKTNTIPIQMSWREQWNTAISLLNSLRTAEVVYTTRLHIALPCMAFGTPVVVPRGRIAATFQPERLRMLDELEFEFDAPFVTDLSDRAQRYLGFLSENLQIPIAPVDEPVMPAPLS